ncbi:MAG TPA: bacteriohopanetetrol glucosamine biosynthesis glycosyltransferase HpnI [Stellaceae bacterium]|nr:bacteriohopanetetrol glucosamine biosynthesis glycosyltransferase HpnI [Stellaceae bacterium]
MLSSLSFYLGDALALLAVVGIIYQTAALVSVRRFAKAAHPRPGSPPAVTILKPVYGLDVGLYDNLRSFCLQDYGAPVQIVIGAHRESDPAVAVARRLIADLPQADIALVVDGTLAGSNFKVCNLSNMMAVAKHPVLVIADSDMRVEPHYLSSVVGTLMQPGVGLVTCLYKGTPASMDKEGRPNGFRDRLGSILGSAYINYGFLPSVLVAKLVGANTGCFGATMAIRRDTLESFGGFGALINQLADDYVLGELVRDAGLKVAIAPYIIECLVLEPGIRAMLRHELRWQRTIRSITSTGLAASVVTNPVGIALAALPVSLFSNTAWLLFAATLAARWTLLYTCNRSFGLSPFALWLVPLRDGLTLAILILSFCGQRVTWRDRNFQVGHDGELTLEGDPLA